MLSPRHQLTAFSPLSLAGILRAASTSTTSADPASRLAEMLCRTYAAESAILFGSGTQALQAAIEVARLACARDGPIAIPAFNCYDVAAAAVGSGAPITLYDIDPTTLSPDMESLERVLSAGARVVVVAPLYGMPVDWDRLEAAAARVGAILIEDAAQSHGALWRGRPLGSLGRLSVLSFGRGKGWTAGGGGALLLRAGLSGGEDPRPANPGAEAKNFTAAMAQWALGRPALYGIPIAIPGLGLGATRYHPPAPPARASRIAAALALETFAPAEGEAVHRREAARAYQQGLAGATGVTTVLELPEAAPGYLRLPVRIRGGLGSLPRTAARLGLSSSYPTTLAALQPVRERRYAVDEHWPGAEELVRELITLPTHSHVAPAERDQLVRMLRRDRPRRADVPVPAG